MENEIDMLYYIVSFFPNINSVAQWVRGRVC